jgi:outer membrane protein TolC
LQEQKNFIKQLIVISRNKYTIGKLSQAELLNFQMEEAKLIGELLSNEKEIASRKSELKTFLGKSDPDFNIPLLEEIKKTTLDFGKIQPDILEKKLLQKNRTLASLEAALDSSGQKLTYAKLGYLPDFEVMAGYTIREPRPGDDGVDLFTGKVGLTLPIWAVSKQSEQIKGAKAEKAKIEALLEASQIELKNSILKLHAELLEADQKIKLFETGILPLSRQAVLAGKSAYLTGKLEYLNLLIFIQNRYQTEIAYFETLIKHESKVAEIESLIGEEIGGGL